MTNGKIDFEEVKRNVQHRILDILQYLMPGGAVKGNEYVCGSIMGGPGKSCSTNIETGAGGDFATDQKWGDVISLWQQNQGSDNMVAAAKSLRDWSGTSPIRVPSKPVKPKVHITTPPEGVTNPPDMVHFAMGEPTSYWRYNDELGRHIFYISRYDTKEGKTFLPWSWSSHGAWVNQSQPSPRPLYGLDLLKERPKAPVLIVEGEKACDAARKFAKNYVCITWPGGANAWKKADWKPIYGRENVLIWGDADKAGEKCALELADFLKPHAEKVKILSSLGHFPEHWDAANALGDGVDTWEKFKKFAIPLLSTYGAKPAVIEPEPVEVVTPEPEPKVEIHINAHPDEVIPDIEAKEFSETMGLQFQNNGEPLSNLANALRLLRNNEKFNGFVWFDTFLNNIFTTWKDRGVRVWEDDDTIDFCDWLQNCCHMRKMQKHVAEMAIISYAHHNRRNALIEWLDSLTWDGTPRIEAFICSNLDAVDSVYTRAASKNFFISLIARAYQPGCKVDNMLVLMGRQGVKKSTVCEIIGGQFYAELQESVETKDFAIALQGVWLAELAELDSLSRTYTGNSSIKRAITCRVDRYRAPYAKSATDHNRTAVLIGTTNKAEFGKDTTGARRYWPIEVGEIDLSSITSCRDQLLAEARDKYKSGHTWYEMPKEETEAAQEAIQEYDEWEGVIREHCAVNPKTTVQEIASNGLKIHIDKLDRRAQNRIGKILRSMGWEPRSERGEGAVRRVWADWDEVDTGSHFFSE